MIIQQCICLYRYYCISLYQRRNKLKLNKSITPMSVKIKMMMMMVMRRIIITYMATIISCIIKLISVVTVILDGIW